MAPAVDRGAAVRFASDMADAQLPPPAPPPLGSWPRLYAAVCAAAVFVLWLLWWFTQHFHIVLVRA